jgi:hypothetical protein
MRKFSKALPTAIQILAMSKKSEFVIPDPDRIQDDGSGIQSILNSLDSGLRRNDALKIFRLYRVHQILDMRKSDRGIES